MTLRILVVAFPEQEHLWTIAIAVLACVSLAVGNLAALVQRNVKRLLAYSSVSHAGFMLIAVAANSELGGTSAPLLPDPLRRDVDRRVRGRRGAGARARRRPSRSTTSAGWAGSGRSSAPRCGSSCSARWACRSPAACSASSTSSPPPTRPGCWWLIVAGVIATAISLYYYLGVIRALYLRPAAELRPAIAGGSPPRDPLLQSAVFLSLVVTVGSFFFVQPLIELAERRGRQPAVLGAAPRDPLRPRRHPRRLVRGRGDGLGERGRGDRGARPRCRSCRAARPLPGRAGGAVRPARGGQDRLPHLPPEPACGGAGAVGGGERRALRALHEGEGPDRGRDAAVPGRDRDGAGAAGAGDQGRRLDERAVRLPAAQAGGLRARPRARRDRDLRASSASRSRNERRSSWRSHSSARRRPRRRWSATRSRTTSSARSPPALRPWSGCPAGGAETYRPGAHLAREIAEVPRLLGLA